MSVENKKPFVELFDFDGIGLIISFPSGVIYTNQVGGLGCFHPELEGVFAPLSLGNKKILFALRQHFRGNWQHIEDSDAELIDKLLRSDGFEFIKVDRMKLNESFEAWVYVDIEQLSRDLQLLNGFGNTKGILTWMNSD